MEDILDLKLRKSKVKTAFTKTKNKLLHALEVELVDKQYVKDLNDQFDAVLDDAMVILEELCGMYKGNKDYDSANKVTEEIDQLNMIYSEATQTVYDRLLILQSTKSINDEPTKNLEKDLWRQMKRVGIPVFYGDKRKYETWKAAFMACIDKAPATPEYKLLKLRQYLKGEALQAIDDLGHSAEAYIAAKDRLERKFGGERRKLMRFMDDIEKFQSIRKEDPNTIEKFADLLDIAVINMKEANREEDLGDGTLYLSLQRKLPEKMSCRFHRWLFETTEEESVETLRNWINQELKYLAIASETKHGLANNERPRNSNRSFLADNKPKFNDNKPQFKKDCKICRSDLHNVWECEIFKSMDTVNRWQKARDIGLCFRCLRDNHRGNECKNFRVCGINGCTRNHHKLLHHQQSLNSDAQEFVPKRKETFGEPKQQQQQGFFARKNQIALRTVPVVVYTENSRKILINALLDDGSTKTYINQSLAGELGLQGKIETVQVNTLNDRVQSFETMSVNLSVESLNGQSHTNIEAYVLDNVTGSLQTVNWNKHIDKWEHLKGINFPYIDKNKEIDMLIGLDYAVLHSSLHEIHGKTGEPIARLTPLGWTCVGQLDKGSNISLLSTYFVNEPDDLDQMLKGFWDIDNSGVTMKEPLTQKEQNILKDSEKEMKYEKGQYEVKIPWKMDPKDFPNDYQMAVRRLNHTEKRLRKEPEIEMAYKETIENYENKGYIRKVPTNEEDHKNKWYLPHFPVVRLEKETTKVRIVFDAAAKFKGVCLNDFIETGPKLQNELFNVLLRFRKYDVALVCDISEKYLRVGIHETDRRFHRFLWDSSEYEFRTLVFGVNASPFLAQLVTQTNAKLNKEEFPLASETVLKSTYMDDSMDSMPTKKSALELYEQLSELWLKAGMYARKWLSNSRTVLEKIPQKERAKEVNLDTSYLPITKALGVTWQAEEDIFTFKLNKDICSVQTVTKRNLLKRVASLFDPLGFLSPYIIKGKILLQQFWLKRYDWDDKVNSNLTDETTEWLDGLLELNKVIIPRSLSFDEAKNPSLHVFVDASELAFGTVVYMRCKNEDAHISVKFVCSKTRVSPLTAVSIPRLELMAAVLGLRLVLNVTKAIVMSMKKVTFWTDSANVIHWISNESRRFKPFVAHRIGEIHTHSVPNQWRHISSTNNPADVASRGTTAKDLIQNTLWWNGPQFLHEDETHWPVSSIDKSDVTKNEFKKKSQLNESSETSFISNVTTEDRLDPERFSDWLRLLRVTAWVKRFTDNCRKTNDRNKSRVLTLKELQEVENMFIHKTQVKHYPEEYSCIVKGQPMPRSSKLIPLNVKIDEQDLMRCDTRLTHARFLPYNVRYPIILPRKSPVTRLLVKSFHEAGNHYGTNQTLAAMSSRYWLIGGREEIRDWEKKCSKRKKLKAQVLKQVMAPLPPIRLKKSMRAFAYSSVDFAGPFLTKQGRGKVRQKRYLCLFTCLSSRAVHLEIAFGLDTDSFLNAFYRMSSRRGFPEEMYSDNGTNFVGAYNELLELYEQMDKQKITEKANNHRIKWHFNPPLAPHFGGVHESMVKSAKRAIYAVLNSADITDEELLTAITGAEGLINSRPISYQTSHPNDDTVLTPNHFIHGQIGGQFAPEAVDSTVFNVRKRWRYVQEIVKHFWHRWLREFIPTLSNRKKWHQETRDLKVNDVVLVIDADKSRGEWSLGRIVALHPGTDKHVRVVDVRMGKNIYRRPITRLCLIEAADETVEVD